MNDKRLLLIFKEIQQRLEKNEARADELAKREVVNGKDGRDGKDGVNGKDGKDGLNGRDGKDGKDGVDGKDGKNGLDGINGKDGLNGRDGKDGKNGKDGRGIKKLYVDKNGHLIVIYTDGKQEDLGRIVGKDGKTEVVVRNSGARTGKDGVSIVDVYIDERRHLICIMSDGQEIDAGYVGGGGGGGAVDDVTVNGTSVVESGVAVIDLTPYALANHNHDGIYALIDHNHDTEYAGINHNHDTDYAAINHNHDADYAAKNHNHDDAYAGKEHEHTVADITDMPDIPTKTSDLDNDSGFLNQQALEDYYDKSEVDTALQGKANAQHTHSEYEEKANKVTAFGGCTDDQYPSALLCENMFSYIGGNFMRNPVLIYDKTEKLKVAGTINSGTDSADGLLNQSQGEGTSRDITSWNIEGMDLSEFKHLRVVFRRKNATYGTTGEFNIPLDCDAVPTRNIYVSGASISAFNDRNRLNTITCAVDSAKTKFCVTQTFSLYGTAVTGISDLFVEKIYGCY